MRKQQGTRQSPPLASPRELRQGASRGHQHSRLSGYFTLHLSMAIQSLGRLFRTPFATLMTAAVIGIALALPTGLHVMLDNLQQAGGNWDGSTQVSLFLKNGVSEDQALQLSHRLEQRSDIKAVQYISAEQALAEFQDQSGFGAVLDNLDTNPLPSVLVLHPLLLNDDPAQAEVLVDGLKQLPEVEVAQLDMQWLKRLFAILETIQRGVLIIAVLLGLAVLLIVGNTIRLAIENRRDEIVITKLIGATNGFIRRPFLYYGIWYGLFGGLLALLLVDIGIWLLQEPVTRLTGLYGSSYHLGLLDFGLATTILSAGMLLGLVGAWIAVGRHLNHIEPR
ncbi:MAG: permease-like cell division protein FtsX [Gammaproteobacteria bacterium]|nr:permease-like cell division protein FtsX [Gammaproteobacteria bacterium]